MTICTAAITPEGIYVVSDCRVTLGRWYFSDCLLKTVFITDRCTLTFAGDVHCAQWVVRSLNRDHIRAASSKAAYVLLKQIARQVEYAFDEYAKNNNCRPYVEFLVATCSATDTWIASFDSKKFRFNAFSTVGSVHTIGDMPSTREEVTRQVRRSLEAKGFTAFNLGMLVASSVESTIALLYREKYIEGHEDYGISPLFTIFRMDRSNGITVMPYSVAMFRGRIADRNEPLGHAPTNEVVYDPVEGKFFLMDHQRGQKNPLMDLDSFQWIPQGIVGTKFNPYTLKG